MRWLMDLNVALHLLAMCISVSGPLVCIPLERRSARGDTHAASAGCFVLGWSLFALLLGGLIGVIVGAFRWNAGLSQLVVRLSSKIYFGQWEFAFSALLMLIHLVWWRRVPHARPAVHRTRQFIALLAGTNLLYHFPVLFVVISELLHRNELDGGPIDASAFRQLLITGPILARSIHVVLASLAAGASLLLMYGLSTARRTESAEHLVTLGARLALPPVLLQIPVGFWTFTQMSALAQRRLLGSDLLASLLFVLGLAAALGLAHAVAGLALGERSTTRVRLAVIALAATIILMTLASRRVMV